MFLGVLPVAEYIYSNIYSRNNHGVGSGTHWTTGKWTWAKTPGRLPGLHKTGWWTTVRSQVPGSPGVMSIQRQCPVVPERRTISFFLLHSHPGKRLQVPLGKGWEKDEQYIFLAAQCGPSSREPSLPFIWGVLGLLTGSSLELIEGPWLSVLVIQVRLMFTQPKTLLFMWIK